MPHAPSTKVKEGNRQQKNGAKLFMILPYFALFSCCLVRLGAEETADAGAALDVEINIIFLLFILYMAHNIYIYNIYIYI